MNMKKTGFLLLVLSLSSLASGEKLAIILLDGFRWDYVDRMTESQAPNFKEFLRTGARAEYVQPIFPSVSFPCWTTIVTGLRAERHGITGNYIYNRETGLEFSMTAMNTPADTTEDPSWWTEHVPLWTSATQAGLRASLYLWGRCDVPFEGGVLPEKCLHYDQLDCLDIDLFGQHLQEAADDLQEGFDLAMVYYGNVDEVGHYFGPDSDRIYEEVQAVDFWLGNFLSALEEAGLREETNVVIVADHGTKDTEGQVTSKVTNFVSGESIEKACDSGSYMHFAVADGFSVDEVVANLSSWEGVDVYKKEDIPDRFAFRDSDLVLDVLLVSQGEELVNQDWAYRQAFMPLPVPGMDDVMEEGQGGKHGFDDTSPEVDGYEEGPEPDMRGIFFANGPGFKPGFVNPWIKLVDEYQVFLRLLDIQGEEHQGDFSRVEGMLA